MVIRSASSRVVRAVGQRRTFVDWMTKYPDKVPELQKIHQNHSVFTWQKIPSDKMVNLAGAGLVFIGVCQLVPGYYHLATGKGKMD